MSKKYFYTLPFPPSVNALFGGGSKQKRFPSKQYKAWLASCPDLCPEGINSPCHVHYRFYWPDQRVRDGQNYLKAVCDFLCKQGVIDDDNWKIIESEGWDHGGVCKEYPRVEVTITVKQNP